MATVEIQYRYCIYSIVHCGEKNLQSPECTQGKAKLNINTLINVAMRARSQCNLVSILNNVNWISFSLERTFEHNILVNHIAHGRKPTGKGSFTILVRYTIDLSVKSYDPQLLKYTTNSSWPEIKLNCWEFQFSFCKNKAQSQFSFVPLCLLLSPTHPPLALIIRLRGRFGRNALRVWGDHEIPFGVSQKKTHINERMLTE